MAYGVCAVLHGFQRAYGVVYGLFRVWEAPKRPQNRTVSKSRLRAALLRWREDPDVYGCSPGLLGLVFALQRLGPHKQLLER